MSPERELTSEDFEEKLSRLRMRIDQLPPEQRPHLVELADAIARQQLRLQEAMQSIEVSP